MWLRGREASRRQRVLPSPPLCPLEHFGLPRERLQQLWRAPAPGSSGWMCPSLYSGGHQTSGLWQPWSFSWPARAQGLSRAHGAADHQHWCWVTASLMLARAGCCALVCSRLGSPNVCSPPGQNEPLRKRRIGPESLTRIGASAPELMGLLG